MGSIEKCSCGGQIKLTMDEQNEYAVHCINCKLCTVEFPTAQEAIKDWNSFITSWKAFQRSKLKQLRPA